MEALRLETTILNDGQVIVSGVWAGQEVEVIVLPKAPREKSYPLRKTQGVFKRPFDPVIPEADWENDL